MENVKIFLLCIFLLGAGWTDLHCGKVSNRWIFVWTAAGVCACGPQFLAAAAVVLVPAYGLFHLRMMGAGDGKMMAVIAGYLGLEQGLRAIGAGLAVGALWSLYRFWCSRNLSDCLKNLAAYVGRSIQTGKTEAYQELSLDTCENTIPLAACLAVGAYVYLLGSCIWRIGGMSI